MTSNVDDIAAENGFNERRRTIVLILCMIVLSSAFLVAHYLPGKQYWEGGLFPCLFSSYCDNDQYAYLADALINGHVWLDLPVAESLKALSNPYDVLAREQASLSSGEVIYWDYAYYDGRYYCYFGVLPALLLYVPFKLLTGSSLATFDAITVLGLLFVVASCLLIERMHRRYFPKVTSSFPMVIACTAMFAGSNVVGQGLASRFYEVPTLTSMALTCFGLWVWLGARTPARDSSGDGDLSCPHLAIGTSLMVLNLMSRPQFALACLLAFPIFWQELRHKRTLFSLKGWQATLCVLIPCVVIAVILGIYNYLRFGSPFNLGSSYNLTGFDMTSYEQDLHTTLLILYAYLFQPSSFMSSFPFVAMAPYPDLSAGWAPTEPMFGGFFILTPTAALTVFAPVAAKQLRRDKFAWLVVLLVLSSLVVLFFDTRLAGLSQRYFADFGWSLMLASILVFFALCERYETQRVVLATIYSLLMFSLLWSFVIGGFSLFSPDRYDSVKICNPQLWSDVAALFG